MNFVLSAVEAVKAFVLLRHVRLRLRYSATVAAFLIGFLSVAYGWGALSEGVTYVVVVTLPNQQAVDDLSKQGFIIDAVFGNTARVYTDAAGLERLKQEGYRTEVVETQPSIPKVLGVYHSYSSLTSELQTYANTYPNITRLYSLGKSVEGRDLWALLITDNPDEEEDEPEFKYVSTMHGDEPVGTELLLYLTDYMLTRYGTDPRITQLIQETEIWLVPLMNPDGLERNTRYNANNRDLNRSFPEWPAEFSGTIFDGAPLRATGREPEVRAVMEWSAANSFVLSANMHTGALVVNYPYDDDDLPSGTNAPTPDDALIRELSLRYSRSNPPMYNSTVFPQGIVNGTVWYSVSGGMQDWNYRYLGCIEVTLELSNTKRPSSTTLATLWENNRESMLRYMESVHIGIRGVVRDRLTGAPVYARVRIDDNPQPVFTDPDVGDYHRLVLPGTYRLHIDAPGYIPYHVSNVEVPDGPATRMDVTLSNGDLNGDSVVDALDVQLVANAAVGYAVPTDADVDGDGVSATDIQAVINRALGRN